LIVCLIEILRAETGFSVLYNYINLYNWRFENCIAYRDEAKSVAQYIFKFVAQSEIGCNP
jgi:hypothetical protein